MFSVVCNPIYTNNIFDIHKYLMKKNIYILNNVWIN